MQNSGDKIKKLRLNKGLTALELAKEINQINKNVKLNENTIYAIENGRRPLSQKNAIIFAKFFGVSLDFLYYGTEKVHKSNIVKLNRLTQIPLYTSISAGFVGVENELQGFISVPNLNSKRCFGVYVHGDSMSPDIPDGAIAIISQEHVLNFGDVGAFSLNGNDFLKMYIKKGNNILLHSINTKYKDILITEFDEFFIYGRLIKLIIDY